MAFMFSGNVAPLARFMIATASAFLFVRSGLVFRRISHMITPAGRNIKANLRATGSARRKSNRAKPIGGDEALFIGATKSRLFPRTTRSDFLPLCREKDETANLAKSWSTVTGSRCCGILNPTPRSALFAAVRDAGLAITIHQI